MSTTAAASPATTGSLTQRQILTAWWPLAASWMLMGLELPAASAILARLSSPEVQLAAYGGIVFPLSLLIEAPIIMMLAASTTLCRDWSSYLFLRRFMLRVALTLTAIHALVAFTPLYDLLIGGIIRPPDEIFEPGRIGLQIMTPWTLAIAVRRFQQGVLIRAERSRSIGVGTAIRLASYLLILGAGYAARTIPGIIVVTVASVVAVTAEAIFVKIRVQPVLRALRAGEATESAGRAAVVTAAPGAGSAGAPPVSPPPRAVLTTTELLRFYVPLAVTPILLFLGLPIVSASLSRMPMPLESLAIWPVLTGLSFTLRSSGLAFNEVVIALLDRARAVAALTRFSAVLALVLTAVFLAISATALSRLWFGTVSSLRPDLASIAGGALWIIVLFPAVSVFQSLYQGIIVHSRRTRAITEAVGVHLLTAVGILVAGTIWGGVMGLYVGLVANFTGNLVQMLWLRSRSRPLRQPVYSSA